MRKSWEKYLDELDLEEEDAALHPEDDGPGCQCLDIPPNGRNGRIIRKQIKDNE